MNKFTVATVVENKALSSDVYLLTLELPFKVDAKPGQFCILRTNSRFDPLLGRPFSIFDSEEQTLKFLYRVKGKGTKILSETKAGESIVFTGPLGRWYPYPEADFLVVAGGIGIASVYYLIKRFPKRAMVFYGVRSEKELFVYEEIKEFAKKIYISTEEGKLGYKGLVTDLFQKKAKELDLPIYACGPMMMIKELKKFVGKRLCYVAVEERMGCGVGACLGCVINTIDGFRRVCIDGPVFEIKELML